MNLTPSDRTLAANFADRTELPAALLKPYVCTIKKGCEVVSTFEAYGPNRVAVQRQHEGLCKDGEQCIVATREEWDGRPDLERAIAQRRST